MVSRSTGAGGQGHRWLEQKRTDAGGEALTLVAGTKDADAMDNGGKRCACVVPKKS